VLLCGATATASSVASAAASSSGTWLMTYLTGLTTQPYVWVALGNGTASVKLGPSIKLGPANNALISPDGAEVAAVSIEKSETGKPSTLSLYPTSGAPALQLTKNVQFIQLLHWSPDSKLILVTVGAQLDVVDVANQQMHTIATGSIYGASFAPGTSEQVVYARSAPNKTAVNLYVTGANGYGTREITHDGLSELPLWGKLGIVYSHETPRAKNPYPALQLWMIKPSGAGAHQLTSEPVPSQLQGLTPVGFSTSGTHLLANFVGPNGSNHAEAFTVDLSKHKPLIRDLSGNGNGNIGDAISGNGRWILVTKGTTDNLALLSIEMVPWAGGKPTTLIAQGGYASWSYS
jgi:hypothetical protein